MPRAWAASATVKPAKYRKAKGLYKRRGQTVEPSFGDAKQHRAFRRVHGRGLDKATGHTGLTVLAHNLWELVKGLLGVGPSKNET